MDVFSGVIGVGAVLLVLIGCGLLVMIIKCYRKVSQGQAIVRNGVGGTKVSFEGIFVIPVLHRAEHIDISVKRIEIDRQSQEGLICHDNMRADIKVAFWVRVNKTVEDVLKVAQSVGCDRASSQEALVELFDAKFSEALKTVGKQFEFIDLYNSREKFKDEILKIIGTDLNGFILDDAAIDYLEQTPIEMLKEDNILDSEGIKKISELTATQKILSNNIKNEEEMTITKQNVEAKEAILEMNRQLAESEEKQKREVANIKMRESAEISRVSDEERLKAEKARIASDEEIQILEENKDRQIIVAAKNKERTDAIETERVEKDRQLEVTEREKIVSLANIEKEKAVEIERKNIQDVIRERVMVEKTVVEEQEKIKDTEAFAEAEREKKVSITNAEKEAEEVLVKDIKAAEASKKANDLHAEELLVKADADKNVAIRESDAKKVLAEGITAESAAAGLAEAQVTEAMATASEKQGMAEARVMQEKYSSEAKGIEEKAHAMKKLDGVGKEHEEFKLTLEKNKEIELREIDIRKDIASDQAEVLGSALKNAKVDIVGGETQFFDRIVGAITGAKSVDRYVDHSKVLSDVKETFFNSDPEYFKAQFSTFFKQFGLTSEDLKNLSISAALNKFIGMSKSDEQKSALSGLLAMAERSGLGGELASTYLPKILKGSK